MPEQIIRNIKKNIPEQWKICLLSAMIMGFAAHLYKLANWLPNWDSLVFRYDAQDMLSMGRWLLGAVCAPGSFYDLPWLVGLAAILFHALGAVCICSMFGIRKNLTAAMIGAAVITFPTVTSVLTYNYVADGYAVAFLLSCMAAAVLVGEKPRYVAAVILIALSAGIYQAYITVTIMLLLCRLIVDALHGEEGVSALIVKSGKFLAAGAVGMVLYYLILTVLLKVTGTALLEYQGIDSAFAFRGLNILSSLYTVKQTFVGYFFDFSNGPSAFAVISCIGCALTVILYLIDMAAGRTGVGKTLLLVVYVLLLPVGASALAFINSEIDYHNLMKMGFFGFHLLLILKYEKTCVKSEKWNVARAWAVLGVMAVLILNQTVLANVSYHKLTMAYEKSYGTLIRIADRVEQTEGAQDCDRVLIVGALPGSEAYSANLPPDMTGTTDGYILRADDEIIGQSVVCSALNDYCGKDYDFVSGEEKAALLEKSSTGHTAVWPAAGSVFVIDDVIVIRLGDEGR